MQPEGLQRGGSKRQSVYRFTHHLFQKYLYDQLDPVERAQLHGGVAAALDRQVGDDLAERARCGAPGLALRGGRTDPANRARCSTRDLLQNQEVRSAYLGMGAS